MPGPSADRSDAKPSFERLVEAYFDCRRSKRNSASALAFEQRLEHNLTELYDELVAGTYRPGPSICFVVTRPKAREVWAAAFRDRIVHHLLYNDVAPAIHATFIADSCACIPGRGTLYGVRRLEGKVRSITQNWSRDAWYLKLDLANFFVSIDKRVLLEQLRSRIVAPWWLDLAELIALHDPRAQAIVQSTPDRMARVPEHKRLTNHPPYLGLPIGNLSSQFFANIYLDPLDQFIKHRVRARHYIRYVDDMVLLHTSPQWLVEARDLIEGFVRDRLRLALNPRKTILQPIARGVDFVGQVVKPHRTELRRNTLRQALTRIGDVGQRDLRATTNSYFGLARQAAAGYRDRGRIAKAALSRGLAVDLWLTKSVGEVPAPRRLRP